MAKLEFALEGTEALGGKRELIISSSDPAEPDLVFNIDTYQNISMSEEREKAKHARELEKLHAQLEYAILVGDKVAEDRLSSQIRFSNGDSIAEQILKYVNDLLGMISDEKSDRLFRYYSDAWEAIGELSILNRSATTKKLTKLTMDLFEDVDLADYCIRYVKWLRVPLPDPSSVGYKTHHSASKTFAVNDPQSPDYPEMTALSFLSKLLFPVWGQYCHMMKYLSINSMDKEFYCLQFLEPALLRSPFKRIHEKFKNYTFDEVRRAMDKSARNPYGNESNYERNLFTLSKVGYSETQFQMLNLAKILVKRLVVFNTEVSSLKGEDNIPNIMIFCQAIMEKNVTNTLKQFNHNSALLTRDEPRGGGDDNFTYLENGSRITKYPPDMIYYSRIGSEWSIPRIVKERKLDIKEFWDAVDFYNKDKVLQRTVFSDAVLSVYMFPIIGSSENLNHLQATQYTMAVVLAQMILLKEVKSEYGESLALMMSAGVSPEPRENKVSAVTTAITATAEKCAEYRELMDRYPHSCETVAYNESIIGSKPTGVKKDKIKGTINIAKHVALIKDWLLDYDHYANIYPPFLKYIPVTSKIARPKQNDILQYSSDFMLHYYQFILDNCPEVVPEPTESDKFFSDLGYR